MLGTQNLGLFIVSGILLNIAPGQDNFYILGRSVAQGRRAGVLSVFGVISGCCVHTCAAAFGLSAVIAASTRAYWTIKLAGAVYLVYLGIRMAFDRAANLSEPSGFAPESSWPIYRAGFFTNLLNPKVILFFLAFLPQFVSTKADSKVLSFLFLGAIFMTSGTIWCLILACSASAMSRRFRENPSAGSILRRTAGALFIALGLKLAFGK